MTTIFCEVLAGDGSDIELFSSFINCHSLLLGSDYKDVSRDFNIYKIRIVAQCHCCDFRYIIAGVDSHGNEILIEDKTVTNRTEGTGNWSKYEYEINLLDRIDDESIVAAIRHIKINAYVDDKASGYDNADLTVTGYAEGVMWMAD